MRILIILALLLFAVQAFSQSITDYMPNNTNYAPNVAAFLKYCDVPVSTYTGMPQIGIPLYTIEADGFSLPITLSYHAGGVRVEEEASWVGLGWSLDLGGQITRVIQGGDDLKCNGFYTTAPYVKDPNAFMGPQASLSTTPYAVTSGSTVLYMLRDGSSFDFRYPNNNGYTPPNCLKDGEPDVFNFKAGGYAGKFIIDRPRNGSETYFIRQIDPTSQVKIVLDGSNMFTITTPDGVIYRYGITSDQAIRTAQPSYYGKLLYERSFTYNDPERVSTNTWYLTAITLINGQQITFSYADETVESYSRNHSVLMMREYGPPQPSMPDVEYSVQPVDATQPNLASPWTITRNRNTQKLITTIAFDNLILDFTGLTDRVDIKSANATAPRRLTKFQVRRVADNKVVKEVRLHQGYFESGSGRGALYSKRLRLDSVAESDGISQLPATRFAYDERAGVLPDKDSFNQDFWGYFNGKDNDATCATLVPRLKEFYISVMYPNYQGNHEFHFSDRSVDGKYISVGTINRISHPTGGITHFVFESNMFQNFASFITSNVAGQSDITGPAEGYGIEIPEYTVPAALKGAGQRLLRSISYDCGSDTYTDRRYDYRMADGRSSGRLMFRLMFHTTSDESFEYYAPGSSMPQDGQRRMTRASSQSNGALGSSAQGAAVGYSRVLEYVNEVLMKESQFINEVEKNYSGFHFSTPAYATAMTFQPLMASYQNPYGIIFQKNYSNPGIPNIVNSSNGKPIREINYQTRAGVTNQLTNTEYSYTSTPLGSYEGLMPRIQSIGPSIGALSQGYFYTVYLKRLDLTRRIVTSYDDAQVQAVDTTLMTYNDDFQMTTSSQKNSRKEIILTSFQYPRNVVDNPSLFTGFTLATYATMVNKHQLNPLVRSDILTNGVLTKRFDVQYGLVGTFYKPLKVEEKNDLTSIIAKIDLQQRDSKGNVLQFVDQSGLTLSSRFAYNGVFPIAEALNSSFNDMAYTSFETAETLDPGWVFTNPSGITTAVSGQSLAGKKYFNLSSPVTIYRSVTTGKTFVVSYWATAPLMVNSAPPTTTGLAKTIGGNTWTYYEHVLINVTMLTVSGTALLDELRCIPQGARLKTRTFDPYVGVTSMTDENNLISYYEYDSYNRLARTRDNDWNILTQNEYHFDVTPNCNLYLSAPKLGAQRNTCWPLKYNGGSITLNWPEGKFVSLTSQQDANNAAASAGQAIANTQAGCIEKPYVDYITKNSGTSITIAFFSPANSTSCEIIWEDLSFHQNGSQVVSCGTSATVTLPGLNRTYYVYVKSYNASGSVISEMKTFTFEGVRSQALTQQFAITACPSVLWPYTVPAGRYQGVDQGAANTFAQQDASTNGPIYANAYGSCSGYNIIVHLSSTKPNITFEIDDVVYNAPANVGNNQFIANILPGTHKFELLCAPSGTIGYNINGQTYPCTGSPVYRTVTGDIYISIF